MKPQPKQLAEEFLAMLAHERAASPHTLRAYQREIDNFAAYLIEQNGQGVEMQYSRSSADTRLFGRALRPGFGEGVGCQVAGGGAVVVSVDGPGGACHQQSRRPGGYSQAA